LLELDDAITQRLHLIDAGLHDGEHVAELLGVADVGLRDFAVQLNYGLLELAQALPGLGARLAPVIETTSRASVTAISKPTRTPASVGARLFTRPPD
jgi:hypothetical protein